MPYRTPVRPPKGEWARFLHRMRQERDWSSQRAFEALHEVLRLSPKSRAAYLKLEAGERPARDWEREALVTFFGESPSDDDRTETSGASPDLASAILMLAEELRAMRQERDAVEARLRNLEADQALRQPQGGAGRRERSVLRGTTE